MGKTETLKTILTLVRQDINAVDEYGNTALILAAANGQEGIATALIEKGADLDKQDNNGKTALI